MNNVLVQLFPSSQNPENVSRTVQGIAKVALGVAGYFAVATGSGQIPVELVNDTVQALGTVATAGYAFVGAIQGAIGFIAKIVNFFKAEKV